MVFERQLDDSIQSWNLCDDTLLFVEKSQPFIINVVELKQRQTATLVSIVHDIPVELPNNPNSDSSSISKQTLSFNDGFVMYGTSNKIYYLRIDKVLNDLTEKHIMDFQLEFQFSKYDNYPYTSYLIKK